MNKQQVSHKPPGILGGMGTIATLCFLSTIHHFDELLKGLKVEQNFSTYLLLNKADTIDRTQCILKGEYSCICADFKDSIKNFLAFKVAYVIPVCFTATCALRLLDKRLQKKIVSIPCIALDLLLQANEKALIFCTEGSRIAQVFEKQPNWDLVKDLVVWPTLEDQKKIHALLYKIKVNKMTPEKAVKTAAAICKKYNVKYFVAGCTEMHIISSELFFNKHHYRNHLTPLDPLLFLAEQIANKAHIKQKYFMNKKG